MQSIRSTTIISVRRDGNVCMAGDGQVTFDVAVMKRGANKIRRLHKGEVLVGFAGSAADALTLFARLEGKLDEYRGNLERAAVELAKDWRSDRILRRLDALMIASSREKSFLISGQGDLIEPDDGILAIGSGGGYALAAAKALAAHTALEAKAIALEAMKIAADICIYTNETVSHEEIG